MRAHSFWHIGPPGGREAEIEVFWYTSALNWTATGRSFARTPSFTYQFNGTVCLSWWFVQKLRSLSAQSCARPEPKTKHQSRTHCQPQLHSQGVQRGQNLTMQHTTSRCKYAGTRISFHKTRRPNESSLTRTNFLLCWCSQNGSWNHHRAASESASEAWLHTSLCSRALAMLASVYCRVDTIMPACITGHLVASSRADSREAVCQLDPVLLCFHHG